MMTPRLSQTTGLVYLVVSFVRVVSANYKEEFAQIETPHHHRHDTATPSGSGGLLQDFAYTASTDESKLRLALLVDEKMDRNKDGLVQLDELVGWLHECQDRYAKEDANRHWSAYKQQVERAGGTLGWSEYAEREYDHLVTISKHSANPEQVNEIKKSHEFHLKRDQRRWKAADANQDGRLSGDEFKVFLYPEHSPQMHPVVVDEKFESLDKDKDGRVSADEFLSSLTPSEARSNLDGQEAWLEQEKSKFNTVIDSNHDKYLDRDELATWVTTSELHDHSISEAQQLMLAADANHDHRLTKEEILAAYHDFVNSHATDFGEALQAEPIVASHDEL